jgi:hypothetical protein
MSLTIDSDVIETDKVKAFENSDGTVVLEDKVNANQLKLNDDVTLADVASHLIDSDNPHTTTLEQARSEDNQLSGAVDAGGNDLTDVGALSVEDLNNDIQLREKVTGGSGTKDNPYTVDESVIDGRSGLVRVGEGYFETDGFSTDPSLDYSNDEGVYFLGHGPHVSALEHVDGTSPVIKINSDSGGNFSGAYRLQVFGAGDGVGDANLIEDLGDTIDSIWSYLYVRYGGGDAIRLGSSASGSRIQNCWLETCSGYGLNMQGGDRAKVSNCHIVGNDAGQVYADVSKSNFSNLTLDGGGHGIELPAGASRNTISNVYVENVVDNAIQVDGDTNVISNIRNSGADISFRVDGSDNQLTKLVSTAPRKWGVFVNGARNFASNIFVDGGRSDLASIRLNSSGNRLSDVYIYDSDDLGGYGLYISDTNQNHIDGLYYSPGIGKTLQIDANSRLNVIDNLYGLTWGDITDNGNRTLINRWGTNDGDPSAGSGQWAGEVEYAGAMGATIWDTSTSPWTPYEAQPDGASWVAV